MSSKKIIILIFAMIMAGEVYYYNHTKNTPLGRERIRKTYNAVVKRPHGTDLVKEPDVIPNEWMAYQRCYPHDEIKLSSYLSGMNEAKELHEASSNNRYEWEQTGPINIGGRITDFAVHENTPETIYVAAASGGIFKTIDEGQSWENIFDEAPVISIGDIAIDPNNEEILYAGTGEANASSYSFLGNGMYKSTDAGENWDHIGLEESGYIGRIIVDHTDSETIYTAACGNLFSGNEMRGIYKSTNGGQDWERTLFVSDITSAVDLVMHPTNPNILYAAMWERLRGLNFRQSFGDTSGIWKTTDGGDNWFELTNNLPTGDDVGRIGIDISKSNPEVLYAMYDMPGAECRVYRTGNGGEEWTRTNDFYLDGMHSYFGWYFGQIRVDPTNENRAYVMGVELYRTDNGDDWILLADYGNTYEIHVDHHAMYIDENSNRIIEGNDGGLYFTYDLGENWTKIDNIPFTQFYAIEVDNTNPERIYGGTQDNSTVRTLTGDLDDWNVILGGDGFYTLVDFTSPNIVYAEYQYGMLFKSTNTGSDMYGIYGDFEDDRKNWSSPLVMDPITPETLYFGTYRVWKSTNAGENWNPVSDDLTDGDDGSSYHTITTLAVSPVSTDIVVAGTDDGNVHLTLDGGGMWNDVTAGLPDRWITRVAADPFDIGTIYVTVSGFRWDEEVAHVYKSIDFGMSWESISSNLPDIPVNCIALDPNIPNRIFVGTDSGIFFTETGGEYWESISSGMPNVPITDIKIHNDTRFLYVGTYGCSSYKIDIDTQFTDVQSENVIKPVGNLKQNYPNPFVLSGTERASSTAISYEIHKKDVTKAEITVYNIKGRKIKVLGNLLNKNSVVWDGTDEHGQIVSSGVYLYKLSIDNETTDVKKCTVVK
jgi:photosystem II stability/assembly factor-like uncharacterized protein